MTSDLAWVMQSQQGTHLIAQLCSMLLVWLQPAAASAVPWMLYILTLWGVTLSASKSAPARACASGW